VHQTRPAIANRAGSTGQPKTASSLNDCKFRPSAISGASSLHHTLTTLKAESQHRNSSIRWLVLPVFREANLTWKFCRAVGCGGRAQCCPDRFASHAAAQLLWKSMVDCTWKKYINIYLYFSHLFIYLHFIK